MFFFNVVDDYFSFGRDRLLFRLLFSLCVSGDISSQSMVVLVMNACSLNDYFVQFSSS